MKLSFFICLAACLQASASTFAQRISLEKKNASFWETVNEIRKQSGYSILCDPDILSNARTVSTHLKNVSLDEALKECFVNQPFNYKINEKTIVILLKDVEKPDLNNNLPVPIKITGKITDEKNAPFPGATIRVKASTVVAVSNNEGIYTINIPDKNAVLIFSSIGFENQEIMVAGRNIINVKLTPRDTGLDEVVVVGYGAQRRRDLTGAVEKVNIADMAKAPVGSFTDALAGRVAGLVVSSADGQPGSVPKIVIRGNNSISQDNSPLYVIDGFPLESPNNNVINPNDIESIEVLKDASATAIYGARGSNGVILISTKKGKIGPTIISIGTYRGFQKMTKKMNLMSPYDFVSYQRERDSLSNNFFPSAAGYITDSLYLKYATLNNYKNISGTDFQDKVFRTSPFQNYDLSIIGGNQQTRFAISGNIFNQDGIMINSGYRRNQGRISVDNTASAKLQVGLIANYSNVVLNGQSPTYLSTGNPNAFLSLMNNVWGYRPVSGILANGQPDNTLDDALFDPVVNANGSPSDYRINPYQNQSHLLNKNITNSLIVNGYADYKFIPQLSLRVTGGISYNVSEIQQFYDSSTIFGSNKTPIGAVYGVNGQDNEYKTTVLSNENILTYNKVFKNTHALNITGVISIQQGLSSAQGHMGTFVPNESLGISGLDEGKPFSILANSSNWTLASFTGRVNYDYKKRYFLTGTFRADGSSKFSAENRWSYFPSGGVKWRLSEEQFFKRLKKSIISDAALRISYGLTGNNRVSDFSYLSPILVGVSPGNNYQSYIFNNSVVTGATPASLGNTALKWETTSQFNTGLDISFFDGRLNFVGDVYRKQTKNLLLNAVIPVSLGYTNAYKNIGSIQNQGIELSLNTTIIKNSKFSWAANFNIAWNKSKVLSLAENQESLLSSIAFDNSYSSLPAYISKIGQPVGQMYGLVWDGVYQYSDFNNVPSVNTTAANAGKGSHWVLKSNVSTNGAASTRGQIQPGDIKYKDLNGDGVISSADYTVIGHGLPVNTGGFGNNFTYKRFDLNIFFQWSFGNDIQNANRMIFEGNSLNKPYFNQFESYNDRWTPQNQTNDYFRTWGAGPAAYSSRTIEDGSYLRLKTAQLGYTFSDKLTKKVKIRSLRLYASGQNIFTITKYSGLDPEVSINNSVLTPGFDFSPYPRARTIVFGTNLTF